MELKEVINKRRTVRDFKDEHIPMEVIQYAIENGFKAPSYNHLKEWNFIILQRLETKLHLIDAEKLNKKIDINQLEKYFKNEETLKKEMYLDAIPKQKKMILDAPVVILVVFKPKIQVEKAKTIYDLNCLASIWTCIENFLLSLAEHNVYGVTYIPQNNTNIKERLGIPHEFEIAAAIPIGYRTENAKILAQKSLDISERIHYEKW